MGNDGNTNTATLYYTTSPNGEPTWTTPNDDPEGKGLEEIVKTATVYTYQLAFEKVGSEDADKDGKNDPLAGARFGIYTDSACTTLIDTVTTNSSGLAISSRVGKGTYYVKELWAPDGYSLNETVYEITADKMSETTTTDTTVTKRVYTVNENESQDGVQVGWLSKDGTFYNMANTPEGVENTDYFKAYTKSESTTSSTVTSVKETGGTGTVTALKELNGGTVENIPNTKLGSLPSTGGIGTTIFTIGGCAIMIIAAALFFASRRKSVK